MRIGVPSWRRVRCGPASAANGRLSGKGLTYAASAQRSADRIFEQITVTCEADHAGGVVGRGSRDDRERYRRARAREADDEARAPLWSSIKARRRVEPRAWRELRRDTGHARQRPQGRSGLGLESAGVEFESTSVTLRASYLDRLGDHRRNRRSCSAACSATSSCECERQKPMPRGVRRAKLVRCRFLTESDTR